MNPLRGLRLSFVRRCYNYVTSTRLILSIVRPCYNYESLPRGPFFVVAPASQAMRALRGS